MKKTKRPKRVICSECNRKIALQPNGKIRHHVNHRTNTPCKGRWLASGMQTAS